MEQCPVRQMNWGSRWMRATQTDHAVYQVHVEMLADDRDQLVELGILVDVVAGGWQVHTLARGDVLQYEAAQWAVVEEPVQARPKVSPSMTGAPLHQEGAGQPLHRCKSHMDFVGGQLCALACSQEALALRYPTCCSMRGLLLQEDSPRPRVSGVGDSTPSGSKRTVPSIW